jgi:signal transduction histidine kinase
MLAPLLGYGVAVLTSGIILLLALALDRLVGTSGFELFLAAVLVSAWFGGLGPGLLATALGLLAIDFLLDRSPLALELSSPRMLLRLIGFVLVALLITYLNGGQRRAQRAEAAVRTRDDVLLAAAHDLKSPLTAIVVLAQLLQQQEARPDTPVAISPIDGLARIEAAARQLSAGLDELLDVAHLQLGQSLRLQRDTFDLVALAREVAATYQVTAKCHTIRVEAAVPELSGVWDRARLTRVLDNLLSNAIKYSPKGGEVRVVLDREADAAGPWAVMRVQDQGVGIPAADLPYVVEPFHRAGNVDRRMAGSGVGLAGVRQVLEQHGGNFAVESAEGVGTTATVRLPLNSGEVRGREASQTRGLDAA